MTLSLQERTLGRLFKGLPTGRNLNTRLRLFDVAPYVSSTYISSGECGECRSYQHNHSVLEEITTVIL